MLEPSDFIGRVSVGNQSEPWTISTGTFDVAVSTLGKFAAGDSHLFDGTTYTEGSAIKWDNLEPGIYEFQYQVNSRDPNYIDAFLIYDSQNLISFDTVEKATTPRKISNGEDSKVWKESDILTGQVQVTYGDLTFFMADSQSENGTSEVLIDSLTKVEDLPFPAPQHIELRYDEFLGNSKLYYSDKESDKEEVEKVYVGTGTKDVSLSSLGKTLANDESAFVGLGVEGSFIQYNNLEDGVYKVKARVYARNSTGGNDVIYAYDGSNLKEFAERSEANIQQSQTVLVSDWFEKNIEVKDGRLAFLALDKDDDLGTTRLEIIELERVFETEDIYGQLPPLEKNPDCDGEHEEVPVTKARLLEIGLALNVDDKISGYLQNEVGNLFEIAALESGNLPKYEGEPISSPGRTYETNGKSSSVEPDSVTDIVVAQITSEGALRTRVLEDSSFFEVKAVAERISRSSFDYQPLGLLDAAQSSEAHSEGFIPRLTFITTGGVDVSGEFLQDATAVKVAIWQIIVYENCDDPGILRNGPALLLNRNVYPENATPANLNLERRPVRFE